MWPAQARVQAGMVAEASGPWPAQAMSEAGSRTGTQGMTAAATGGESAGDNHFPAALRIWALVRKCAEWRPCGAWVRRRRGRHWARRACTTGHGRGERPAVSARMRGCRGGEGGERMRESTHAIVGLTLGSGDGQRGEGWSASTENRPAERGRGGEGRG